MLLEVDRPRPRHQRQSRRRTRLLLRATRFEADARRRCALALVMASAAACFPSPVLAGGVGGVDATGHGGPGGPGVSVNVGGSSNSGGTSGSSNSGGGSNNGLQLTCTLHASGTGYDLIGPVYDGPREEGMTFVQVCRDQHGRDHYALYEVGPNQPTGQPTAAQLADHAAAQVALPLPNAQINPANQWIVNLDAFLWVDNYTPHSASASAGGLTATATATPTSTRWHITAPNGEHTTITCQAGQPWTPGTDTTNCHYQPTQRGEHTIETTISYNTAWTATNGDGGNLGTTTRTTTVTINTIEIDTNIVSNR